MHIKYLNYFLYFLFCVFFMQNSFSEEWKGACETNYPPFNYIKNGTRVGMDYEIIALVMKKLGIGYSIRNDSWDKVILLLKEDEIDFVWQFVPTSERHKLFYLVGPIRYGLHVFMVRNNSVMTNWHSLSDFEHKKIGVVKEYNYTSEFDKYKEFSKVEFANNEELISGLIEGFVDAIIGDYYTLSFVSRIHSYSSLIRFLPSSVKTIPRYVAFSKKNKEKSIKFSKALQELIHSKEYQAIIDKYSAL
jgi:polar amino acid transport system substrate-binding protein